MKQSSVAQWWSTRLLTDRLLVRVQPGEFFLWQKLKSDLLRLLFLLECSGLRREPALVRVQRICGRNVFRIARFIVAAVITKQRQNRAWSKSKTAWGVFLWQKIKVGLVTTFVFARMFRVETRTSIIGQL